MSPEKIILFDGLCNLCNGLVKFIIKNDHTGRIGFASLQSSFAQGFMRRHHVNIDDGNSVIYICSDHYYLRSTAILKILRDLGRSWKLMYLFMILPRFIRDAVYNLVAKYRYRVFGKRESCLVPSPDIRNRFLD